MTGLRALPNVIRLERFPVAPTYDSNRIVYRDQSFKRNEYVYCKWHTNPGDLATQFIYRDMRQSGLFKAVLPHDSRLLPSHVLKPFRDLSEIDTVVERALLHIERWKDILAETTEALKK